MADRKVLAHERNVEVARTFYESALADYDHAVVLDPQVPPSSGLYPVVRLASLCLRQLVLSPAVFGCVDGEYSNSKIVVKSPFVWCFLSRKIR